MIFAFTITETKYLVVRLFLQYDAVPFILISVALDYIGCAIFFVSGRATNTIIASQNHSGKRAHQVSLFSNKIFSLNLVLLIFRFMVLL